MSDILGPANAAFAVTVRPADTRTFGALDTFFTDCSSPSAADGTDVSAAFLNEVLGNLRSVARVNGNTVGGTSIVSPDNSDAMLANALQHFVQRGRAVYAVDAGTVNALQVTLTPAPPELIDGMEIAVKILFDSTGPSTLQVNGGALTPIKRQDAYGGTLFTIRRYDLRKGTIARFRYDGTYWQLASPTFGMQASFFNQTVATGGTLTQADLGSIVQLGTGTGNYTVTLPPQSTCVNGGSFEFFCNSGTYTPTLACQGSDTIAWPDGTSSTSLVMKAGDTLKLVSTNVTGLWLAVGGTVFGRYSSDFAKSLAASGYQRLPSGLIMQWGQATTTSSSTATYVSLPTSFASAMYVGTISDSGASAYTWALGNNGTGSIAVYARNTAGNLVSGASGQFIVFGK